MPPMVESSWVKELGPAKKGEDDGRAKGLAEDEDLGDLDEEFDEDDLDEDDLDDDEDDDDLDDDLIDLDDEYDDVDEGEKPHPTRFDE
jgi:DNA-directed RNA polymerase subunit delta